MPYNQTTLASAIAELASRLSDPNNVHWTQTELQDAITKSLRIRQALTSSYRERVTFQTAANQVFYNLRTTLNTTPDGYPYSFSVTDDDLLGVIQSELLEPRTNPWTGTLQFNIATIAAALQLARDQFLSDTGSFVTRTTQGVIPSVDGRFALPVSTFDVRRAGWQDSTSLLTYGLIRTDEYAYGGYRPSWPQNPQLPDSYSVAVTPPLSLQAIPAPTNAGTLDLCLLSAGPTLACNPISPVEIGVMNDYSWGVEYGALETLLSDDGPPGDQDRSQFCRQMYNLAVSLAKRPITLLYAEIAGLNSPIGTMEDYDRYRVNWQNETPAQPTDIISVAPNLIAVTPPPDGVYTISLDIARSMVVPLAPGDFLQISPEALESVLNMSQHIATFKSGGVEFADTVTLRDDFLRMCALENSRLRANIFFNQLLSQPATKPELAFPRLLEKPETANAVSS